MLRNGKKCRLLEKFTIERESRKKANENFGNNNYDMTN